jgi:hypothetical protein
MVDVIMLERWNLALGIPDKVGIMFGDAVLQPMCQMLAWIPASLLLSRVCPVGLESTVYAFLAGISNLAWSGSVLGGGLVMDMLSIQGTVPCSFSHLTEAVIICHVVLPLLFSLLVIYLYIPQVGQDEPLLE